MTLPGTPSGDTDLVAFYERLGWRGQRVQETVFFQAGPIEVALWGRGAITIPDFGAV